MYLGTIPFIFSGIGLILFAEYKFLDLDLKTILSSYALLIGSFMAGIHWGQKLEKEYPKLPLQLISNIVTLSFWFAFLLLPIKSFLIISGVLFLTILATDYFIRKRDDQNPAYYLHRAVVTGIVVCCLFVSSNNI